MITDTGITTFELDFAHSMNGLSAAVMEQLIGGILVIESLRIGGILVIESLVIGWLCLEHLMDGLFMEKEFLFIRRG